MNATRTDSIQCSDSKSGGTPQTAASVADSSKYFVYDVPLVLNTDLQRVYHFGFEDKATTQANGGLVHYQAPKKITLSPNKRLLLILGAYFKGESCLLVYPTVSVPLFILHKPKLPNHGGRTGLLSAHLLRFQLLFH
jgi:hypothetical protein